MKARLANSIVRIGNTKSRSNSERGSAILEAAIVSPIMILLLFGIIQYGFIFAAYVTLRTASAAGARYISMIDPNASADDVRSVVNDTIQPMLNPDAITSIDISDVSVNGNTAKRVEVGYRLALFFRPCVPFGQGDGTLILQSVTVMR